MKNFGTPPKNASIPVSSFKNDSSLNKWSKRTGEKITGPFISWKIIIMSHQLFLNLPQENVIEGHVAQPFGAVLPVVSNGKVWG